MNSDIPLDQRDTTPADLVRENEKLRKINRVLMERVERSTDVQGAFSLFQTAIALEKLVQQRTAQLRELNDDLQVAKDEAVRANVSKTKFFAAASHDLLQPLNVACLLLDALAERSLDPEARHIVERIDASLRAAESLITSLLEIARLDAGALLADIGDYPIDPLLGRLADAYGLQAEERGLRIRVVPCDAVVRTDIRLLERMVSNLLSNALRYTSAGGVLLGCRRRGAMLRIEVWDTGIGIPESRLGEIFEEFRQLEVPWNRADGIGLGLAIVDRIARLLDLRVHVRSREGRGSVFSIDVPFGDRARCTEPESSVAGRATPNLLQGKTVLVVDDDAGSLSGMALVFRTWGCRTVEATSDATAIDAARNLTQRPDFIVADYHLGGGRTGLDVIREVERLFAASVAAVVISADRSDETRALVTNAGRWFLPKPIRVDRLRSLMSHALA